MNLLRKALLGCATLGACLGISTLNMNAQSARFTMPVEAHWNGSVLEPGEYTVSFPSAANPLRVLRVYGPGTNVNIVVPWFSQLPVDSRKAAYLTLVNVNGAYVVKSLDDTAAARKFEFKVPKAPAVDIGGRRKPETTEVAINMRQISH